MEEKEKRKEKSSDLRDWIIIIIVVLALIVFLQWLLAPALLPDPVEPTRTAIPTEQVIVTKEAD